MLVMSSLEFRKPEKDPVVENVVCAALEWQGKLFTGATHALALLEFFAEHPDQEDQRWHAREGFLTNRGRFVDRQEAMRLAIDAGQLRRGARLDGNFGLRSEDLP